MRVYCLTRIDMARTKIQGVSLRKLGLKPLPRRRSGGTSVEAYKGRGKRISSLGRYQKPELVRFLTHTRRRGIFRHSKDAGRYAVSKPWMENPSRLVLMRKRGAGFGVSTPTMAPMRHYFGHR